MVFKLWLYFVHLEYHFNKLLKYKKVKKVVNGIAFLYFVLLLYTYIAYTCTLLIYTISFYA
ncbi:hypothetical protein SAMN00120144_3602 [Hymenobacter roseosalivarius DSM 11622]|uniref:Uncharacterized protein n=1 Tax=Hymenobacter roseosalivarius DSM 11622 TaxID=645990 RepID=A0A1W1W2B2_9BACT|nr:hypothetical protein SAMN00120144_3602 [Hymenobacter roseosalivarius DSM 11622]